jgi:hypothetical protein
MYDRQRCSEMCESLIPHFNYSKIVTGGLFVISFIDVPAKNAKQLKPFLGKNANPYWKVVGGRVGETHV